MVLYRTVVPLSNIRHGYAELFCDLNSQLCMVKFKPHMENVLTSLKV